MHNKITPALERAKRSNGKGIYLYFYYCNLDEQAVLRLASAVQKSTCISGINCDENPGNNARTEEAMKRAIIATKSPITMWNNVKVSADIVQARREREAKEKEEEESKALQSPVSARLPTTDEFDLAQSECASIRPQITRMKKELKLAAEQIVQEEAKKKALKDETDMLQRAHDEQMKKLQRAHQEKVEKLQQDVKKFEAGIADFNSGSVRLQAQVDELTKKLEPHEVVIKRVHDLKGMIDKFNLSPSVAAVPPPPSQAQDANLCPCCNLAKINAVFLCGHRVCKPCGDGVLAEKESCFKCSKPVTGVIPIL